MGPPAEHSRGGAPRPGGPNPVVRALAHGLARYRFGLAGAAAVLLVLTLLPASRPDRAAAGKPGGGSSGFTVIDPTPGRKSGPRRGRPAPAVDTMPETAAPPGPGGRVAAAPRPSATTSSTGRAAVAAAGPALLPSPACDAATGRLAVPSRFAPPCVPSVVSNRGATWAGVTPETITVAVYLDRGDVAAQALAAAAGNRDSADEVAATYRSYVD
ncbi:MAG TPA: hypothetical protein VGR20_24925, partial [Acidimicrobiia bacterium]|nr:hypothetical protein [Acidimicrobiia bacterium]